VSRPAGILLVVAGLALVIVGLLVLTGGLSWFGRLPGDIRIERGNVRFYFPLVSMLLVSLALTLLVNLLRRLF
jgi:membrane protein implicated in regulation of membrane protease activity